MSILSARLSCGVPLIVSAGFSLIVACSSDSGDGGDAGAPHSPGGSVGTAGVAGSGVGGSVAGTTATAGTGTSSAGTLGVGGSTGGTVGGSSPGSAGKTSAGTGGAAAGSAGTAGSSGAATGGSGGTTGGSAGAAPTGGTGGSSGGGEFKLTSPNHEDGAEFAGKYTCSEKGFMGSIMPELNWTPVAGADSYAITFIDVTLAPGQVNGYHWGIYGIPASTTSLPEGMKNAMRPEGSTQVGLNPPDYLGPCPGLAGGGPDDYEFTIYALPASANVMPTGSGTAAVRDLSNKLEAANALATAKLTGTSNARQP